MEDDQQFCLRWNNHQTTLIQNFDTLLESGTLVDCTLAAEGKYLKAHKVVLSACSPYFEGLLNEHYDKHPVFILKDVKFKELKAMMDYMYRGEVNISQDQLAALLKAAESLQIKGLSESKTGGSNSGSSSNKPETRQQKAVSQPTATSLDIPHASSGLTIEKNTKVPRQSLAQTSVSDLPEDSASPQLSKGITSREGSQSPTTRKRKRFRRRSIGDDSSMDNHEASNSSDMPQQMNAPALGIAPVADEKSHVDASDPLGRSALMQQLTKPADELLQMPIEKPEPNDALIEPKSEYLEDPEESVEDLTLDDDMNDLNEMEQDNNRAGPSHDPSQHPGLAAWHVSGDRSNAGGVVGSVTGAPGTTDEVFLAAQEAAQAHRDSQESSGQTIHIREDQLLEKGTVLMVIDNNLITVEGEIEVQDNVEMAEEENAEPEFVTEECLLDIVEDEILTHSVQAPREILIEESDLLTKSTTKKRSKPKKSKKKNNERESKSNIFSIYQCDLCGEICAWASSLDRHRRVCEMVQQSLPDDQKELQKKSNKTAIDTTAVLQDDRESFDNNDDTQEDAEIEIVHLNKSQKNNPEELYTCQDCGKSYQWASSLVRHRAIECGSQNKRLYSCSLCKYRTGYKTNYMRHIKTPRHISNKFSQAPKSKENI